MASRENDQNFSATEGQSTTPAAAIGSASNMIRVDLGEHNVEYLKEVFGSLNIPCTLWESEDNFDCYFLQTPTQQAPQQDVGVQAPSQTQQSDLLNQNAVEVDTPLLPGKVESDACNKRMYMICLPLLNESNVTSILEHNRSGRKSAFKRAKTKRSNLQTFIDIEHSIYEGEMPDYDPNATSGCKMPLFTRYLNTVSTTESLKTLTIRWRGAEVMASELRVVVGTLTLKRNKDRRRAIRLFESLDVHNILRNCEASSKQDEKETDSDDDHAAAATTSVEESSSPSAAVADTAAKLSEVFEKLSSIISEAKAITPKEKWPRDSDSAPKPPPLLFQPLEIHLGKVFQEYGSQNAPHIYMSVVDTTNRLLPFCNGIWTELNRCSYLTQRSGPKLNVLIFTSIPIPGTETESDENATIAAEQETNATDSLTKDAEKKDGKERNDKKRRRKKTEVKKEKRNPKITKATRHKKSKKAGNAIKTEKQDDKQSDVRDEDKDSFLVYVSPFQCEYMISARDFINSAAFMSHLYCKDLWFENMVLDRIAMIDLETGEEIATRMLPHEIDLKDWPGFDKKMFAGKPPSNRQRPSTAPIRH